MRNLIPILIFLIVIIAKVVRAVQEQKQSSGGNNEGWWEDETGNRQEPKGNQAAPTRAAPAGEERKPRPEPSSHVREILRQLQQQAQPKPAPAPAPVRRYLEETTIEADLTQAARQSVSEATGGVYEQSIAAAFPKAGVRALRISGAKQRPPIRVRACGKVNLRRAILISEILGPPRAFDV